MYICSSVLLHFQSHPTPGEPLTFTNPHNDSTMKVFLNYEDNENKDFHVKLYEKSNIKCDFLDNVRNKLDLEYEIFGRYQEEKMHGIFSENKSWCNVDE